MQFRVKSAELLPRDGYENRLFPVCNMLVTPDSLSQTNAFVRVPRPLLTVEPDIQNRMQKLIVELEFPKMKLDGQILNRFLALIKAHINVFQISAKDIGYTTTVTHKIKLIDGTKQVSARCRPVPYRRKSVMDKYIDE